jgi:hypothetical protein
MRNLHAVVVRATLWNQTDNICNGWATTEHALGKIQSRICDRRIVDEFVHPSWIRGHSERQVQRLAAEPPEVSSSSIPSVATN